VTDQPILTARLSMYDWPQLQAANDAIWAGWQRRLLERGIEAPARLDRTETDESSVDRLLVGQVCGITFVRDLASKVRLIATPCYAAEGCQGPNYRSMIVVAANSQKKTIADLASGRAAINSRSSFSGWFALHAATGGGERYFRDYRTTGGHLASAQSVADGQSDCAAIDAVCWALIGKHVPALRAQLRVVGQSPSLPGLPFITGPSCDENTLGALRESLFETLADPALSGARENLLLTGAEILEPQSYRLLLDYASPL